jgi:hypothetical protein
MAETRGKGELKGRQFALCWRLGVKLADEDRAVRHNMFGLRERLSSDGNVVVVPKRV